MKRDKRLIPDFADRTETSSPRQRFENPILSLKPMRICLGFFLLTLISIADASSSKQTVLKADLRADTNRDGEVFLGYGDASKDDKKGQYRWTWKRGALVLPNLDDDADRCDEKSAIQKASVTACNDSKDDIINGDNDLDDLAPLRLMPWPDAPNNAKAVFSIGQSAKGKARLFIQENGGWQLLSAHRLLTAKQLRDGVNLRLEALDVVRQPSVWDGRIDVIVKIFDGTSAAKDMVQLHVAPMILQSDLMKMKRLYLPGMPWAQDSFTLPDFSTTSSELNPIGSENVSKPFSGYLSILDAADPNFALSGRERIASAKLGLIGSAYKAFYDDFVAAAKTIQPKPRIVGLSTFEDPWVQDMFEMAFAAVPKANGKIQGMHLAIRSPQPQRFSARIPLAETLGPNVGIVEQWVDESGLSPKNGDYSLNSTGNFGTIPPYAYQGKHYPLGRVLYGAGKAWVRTGGGIIDSSPIGGELQLKDRFPDKSFVRMLAAQGLQKPLFIDTAWLAVGHIDEIVAFVPAETERGWKVVVADPQGAWSLLTGLVDKGLGSTKFLSRLEPWVSGLVPEDLERTVADVVNTPRLALAQKTAHRKIVAAINTLKAETGIVESDIIRVPVLFEPIYFNKRSYAALTPNAANLVVLDKHSLAVAKQHGPLENGIDVFENAIADSLASAGLSVRWVEDYVQAHGGSGEIHCQSNALRLPENSAKWWETERPKSLLY